MKQVTGFTIADGRFFESMEEADYEENKLLVEMATDKAIQVTKQNSAAFIDFIEKNAVCVRDFCLAYLAFQQKQLNPSELELLRKGETFSGTDAEQGTIKEENAEPADRSGSGRSATIDDPNKV
jgi:hypothetical protein